MAGAPSPIGSCGRSYAARIEDCNEEGVKRSQTAFVDRRATVYPEVRRNITIHHGMKAPAPIYGRNGLGREYQGYLQDPASGLWYPKSEFVNMSIRPKLRGHDGFNIHARCTQKNQYRKGYKLDGFVVADDSDEEEVRGRRQPPKPKAPKVRREPSPARTILSKPIAPPVTLSRPLAKSTTIPGHSSLNTSQEPPCWGYLLMVFLLLGLASMIHRIITNPQ